MKSLGEGAGKNELSNWANEPFSYSKLLLKAIHFRKPIEPEVIGHFKFDNVILLLGAEIVELTLISIQSNPK